jgi:putative SOS response-associated peptidase YedK
MNRYVGNLPPMPGVFPDYQAPVVRNAGAEREMVLMRWGMPPPPRIGGPPVTNIRNTSSPHWRERSRRADPLQGHAGDPHDGRRAGRLDARAVG